MKGGDWVLGEQHRSSLPPSLWPCALTSGTALHSSEPAEEGVWLQNRGVHTVVKGLHNTFAKGVAKVYILTYVTTKGVWLKVATEYKMGCGYTVDPKYLLGCWILINAHPI